MFVMFLFFVFFSTGYEFAVFKQRKMIIYFQKQDLQGTERISGVSYNNKATMQIMLTAELNVASEVTHKKWELCVGGRRQAVVHVKEKFAVVFFFQSIILW